MERTLTEINNEFGVLSRIFSSRAVAQIMDFFLDHKEFDYSANEIAQKTGLSFRTIFREIPDLESRQLIFNTRKIGKVNMYKLNVDLKAIGFLEKFSLELSQIPSEEPNAVNTNFTGREDQLLDEIDRAADNVVPQTES